MNNKLYWSTRKKINKIVFRAKSFYYKFFQKIELIYRNRNYRILLSKKILIELLKCFVLLYAFHQIDKVLMEQFKLTEISNDIFIDIIITCIEIFGVILGLFCANVSTVYSSRYSNVSGEITNLFLRDRKINSCIWAITDFIIICLGTLVLILKREKICWGTVLEVGVFAIVALVNYGFVNSRTYQLSNITRVLDDEYSDIETIVSKKIKEKPYINDISFQKFFQRRCEIIIHNFDCVIDQLISSHDDNSISLLELMKHNNFLINVYWRVKRLILNDSYWFREKAEYRRWHATDSTEIMIAMNTGTGLNVGFKKDKWWFEDAIFGLNQKCMKYLNEAKNYAYICDYLFDLIRLSDVAISSGEIRYYSSIINGIIEDIKKDADNKKNEEISDDYLALIDTASLFYINIILSTEKYHYNYNFSKTSDVIIKEIDTNNSINNCKTIRNSTRYIFYKKVFKERRIEGRRITPDWVIKQQIALEEHENLLSIEEAIDFGVRKLFDFGAELKDKNLIKCTILTRFYEYRSKLNRLFIAQKNVEEELIRYIKEEKISQKKSSVSKLEDTLQNFNIKIPKELARCVSGFVLANWENRDNPDYLGETFHFVCQDTVDSICKDNLQQFRIDYDSLTRLMLLYQEYIRADLINKNTNPTYIFKTFISPIIEWAEIGGLAILWGEFNKNNEWKKAVADITNDIIFREGNIGLAEKITELINAKNDMFLMNSSDLLTTGWKSYVENTIKKKCNIEYTYTRFSKELKTDSELLKIVCDGFDFRFNKDPSEVYLILCLNPRLDDEKKYKTKFGWEKGHVFNL